jgi:hypothetical protein
MTTSSAAWNLPDTEVARAAEQLMFDVSPAFLANHNVRSYLFARELAAAKGLRSGVDYDDELVFLSCILHDLGATDYANTDQRFEVDGADAAATFLRTKGVSENRVAIVWQAIALHTSHGIAHKFGIEQAITQMGISLDIAGANKQLLAPDFADRVHQGWPRHDAAYALAEAIARQVEANPLKAPALTFPAHVHELIYQIAPPATFFDRIRHAGWGDQVKESQPAPS